jgi:two-component system cell cycle sensor histidine kinase PleC|tara:strand:- start:3653 stop:5719 length:2067 start_codon:yes stop_codon:yes gene_type:complete
MSFKSVFKIKNAAAAGTKSIKTPLEKKSDAVEKAHAHISRALFNAQGLCVYADPQFNALHKDGALEGTNLLDFVMFDDVSAVAAKGALQFGAAETASTITIEDGIQNVSYFDLSRGRSTDGEHYPAQLAFQTINTQNGADYIMASFPAPSDTDIENVIVPAAIEKIIHTKNAKQKLNREASLIDASELSEQDVSTFLNMSHELMAIIQPDGGLKDINSTIHRNLGYSAEQLGAMDFIDLIHPEDRAHVRTIIKSIVNESHDDDTDDSSFDTQNSTIFFETRIVARDGETRWTEWKVRSTQNALYTVGRDMTDAKRHEDELIRHQTQLSEAQEIGQMGHWRWEIGQGTISWSAELFRIFGVCSDKFSPSIDSVNSLLRRRDVGRMMQAFQRAMIEKNNYEMEFSIALPNNEERSLKLQGRCELDTHGDVSSLFGVIQDVTERTNHERDLRNAKEAAERAYAAKSQFLANMSHELRTPLNAIIGFSEMMQRQLLGPIGTEKYLDYIAGIRESGEHLLDLISDILDMSKMEAGKYELDVEPLHIAKVVRLAVHMMEGKANDAKVKMTLDINNEDIQIDADRRAILQVMLNLLSNAVKFSNEGGLISVHCQEEDDGILIWVKDNGIGIPADKINDITNPFEQAASHDTRSHEGSGLGLSITKELVELHNGTLRIESCVGEGTCVKFHLPQSC